MPRVYERKDRTGDKVNMLLVLYELPEKVNGRRTWMCRCDCGKEVPMSAGVLSSGVQKSCGCLQKERARQTCTERNTKHSMSDTKEYRAWAHVKQRTRNPNVKCFSRYGKRGIDMSDSLFDSFDAFLAEIGYAPSQTADWSVGRIDNSKGYVEGNLGWETILQQQRNKRMQHNNTCGLGGVYRKYCRGILYFVADWRDLDGKRRVKMFSSRKYGEICALELAKEYRLNMIEELNALGAGYNENHGKEIIYEKSCNE